MITTLLGSNVKQALGSLATSKLRTFLTMLGIIIGVASVILMLGAGRGAEELILKQVEDLGSNIIFMLPGGDGGKRRGPPAAVRGVVVKTMKMRDVETLIRKESMLGIRNVSAFTSAFRERLKPDKGDEINVSVQGRDINFFNTRNFTFAEGKLWSEADEKAAKKVAVIGGGAMEKIFGDATAPVIGKTIKIKGQGFKIVGVLEKKGAGLTAIFGQNDDDAILIPTVAAQRYLLGVDYLGGIQFEVINADNTEDVIDRVTQEIRKNHNLSDGEENDFSTRSQQDAIDVLGTITGVFTVFLAAVAAISLIVGGIGIMNIMLVVVTERTKEIGLRKAIGARRSDILFQFLVEAVVITMAGGLVGVFIGLCGTYALSLVGGWTFVIDWEAIGLALGVSALFGIAFGMYPANKASKLDPIIALRFE